MKTFGKILLGFVIVFFGMTLFNYANSFAVHKDVGEQGDKAYIEDDLTFFKNRFEYHKELPILEEHIVFQLEDKIVDSEITGEVSLDLYIFQSANVKETRENYLTILVKDLTVPEGVSKGDLLEAYFHYSVYEPRDDEVFNIVKIGKENWYLQWIKLTFDDILGFKLLLGDLVLYEYDELEPLLSAEDHNMLGRIENKNIANSVILSLINEAEATDVVIEQRTPKYSEAKEYKVDFKFRLSKGVQFTGDLYLSGEFNDWAENDENYKLTKNKNDVYEATIEIESKYADVLYNIRAGDGTVVAVDGNKEIRYFVYKFNDVDNHNLEDYNINESNVVKFNNYSHYKWITIGIYIAIIITVGVLIYLLTRPKGDKEFVYENGPNERLDKEALDNEEIEIK